ncbi:Trichome birefringence-like, N-terminal domain [Dillenia turbinata]|uniref:Trichome birefringence-like, N-terminal domain n=1 Tax=Dillenia turbinata TaxID=194707 RepID=A0AAN8V1K4_9MAGN
MGYLLEAISLFLNLLFLVTVGATKAEQFHNYTSESNYRRELANGCNWFRGKWVYDSSNPLYTSSSCPFIDPEFDCQKYHRPDTQYLKYRWQPSSCDLPRFNGLVFLEKWRGKKIMFVGDSLSFNQWQSLSCMIHAAVPNSKYSLIRKGPLASLTFEDYGVKLMLYRTPYLVDMVREKRGVVLKWVNRNVDPSKTEVFFQGASPTHYEGKDWNEPSESCKGQSQPFFGPRYPAGIPLASIVINKVLSRIKKPVFLLDITTLSQYRKDAHPSYYGKHNGLDCSHWCLPGLPDTWNELLYAALS